jgi:micrococcal nuclease
VNLPGRAATAVELAAVRGRLVVISLAAALLGPTSVLTACDGDGSGDASSATTAADVTAIVANASVTGVIDGDTIDVHVDTSPGHKVRVRLIGIDTPETVKPNTPVQCYGPEAHTRTEALLPPGTRVRLERDVEARDAYDRLLAYVYRAGDGLFVNRQLVVEGFARTLRIEPNTAHAAEFAAAAADAERADLGLWGTCSR